FAPGHRVLLPERNLPVVRITSARQRDEGFAHLIGHALRRWSNCRRARLVDVVEHQLNVGCVRRAELTALARRSPIELISVSRKTGPGALFRLNHSAAP